MMLIPFEGKVGGGKKIVSHETIAPVPEVVDLTKVIPKRLVIPIFRDAEELTHAPANEV